MKAKTSVFSTSLSVGLATGLYGISFGALSVTAGLDFYQTMALSLLMFSGGSQFAFIGVLGAGISTANLLTAAGTAWLLGIRNGIYAIRLAPLVRAKNITRISAAQLTIDESMAVATAQQGEEDGRKGFWLTGGFVFLFWNLMTAGGALLGGSFGDPKVLGLDTAAAAAFLALLWPRLKALRENLFAFSAALLALISSLVLPSGIPVLVVAAFAVLFGLFAEKRAAR